MEIRSFLIMLLLFSGVITGISIFMSDLTADFGQNINDLSILSQAEAIQNKTAIFQNESAKITGASWFDAPLIVIKGFITFIDLIGTTIFGFFTTFTSQVFGVFRGIIPIWFIGIVSTILIIIILFEIISAVIKWRI